MKTVLDVWYGQRSLAQTFWGWNILAALVIGLGGAALFGGLAAAVEKVYPIYLYLALLIPVQIWITVGLWRSATNNPGGWAVVVKILVVIGVILNIVRIPELFGPL